MRLPRSSRSTWSEASARYAHFLVACRGESQPECNSSGRHCGPANEIYLSAVSVWELAIKIGNQKLSLSDPLDLFINKWTAAYQLVPLPVQLAHAIAVSTLPAHHKDPFDRLLIVQATAEAMTLVTGDSKFAPYGVPILW